MCGKYASNFARDDAGAVTVDWVVLTAALVGLGLATLSVINVGVASLADETREDISGTGIITRFPTLTELLSTDFSGGLGGWNGGELVTLAGFGDVLQLGPGALTTTTLDIPRGAQTATLTFDLLGVDDLSGASASIYVNGQEVAIYSDNHGNIQTSTPNVPGVSVGITQHYENDPMGGGSHGHDSRATYTITLDNPGDTVTFGVGSNSDQPISDEFYAIDDVAISAE